MTAQRSFMPLALAASSVVAVAFGLRNCMGLFISPINSHTALGYATISFAFAVMQLMWGVSQPVAGAMSDRWGPRPVLLGGALLLAGATALIPFATSAGALVVVLGIAFACGFHIAFIATHLPGVVALCMLPPSVGAWSLSIIGLFNVFGALWIGRHIQAHRMKVALSAIYFGRALLIVAFVFSPKVPLTFFIFSAGIGFTYLSTVPPTIGLVAKLHGPRYLATLFGLVMLSHQIGGFLGAYLGGKAFEATGSSDWMWWADGARCLMAAAVHLPIRESQPQLAAAAA